MKYLMFLCTMIIVVMFGLMLPGGKITPDSTPEEDRADINKMIQTYYELLRQEKYVEATYFYESGTFDDPLVKSFNVSPPKMLKLASEMTGIPDQIKLEGLRLNGDTASAEVVIEREGIGSRSLVLSKEETNKKLGTWAKTLHFARENKEWKIAKFGDTKSEETYNKALVAFDKIQN